MGEMNLEQTGGQKGKATVSYSVFNEPGDFAGMTVADVRKKQAALWNIPGDAAAYNGKNKLDETYVIKPGDAIAFHRRQGEKGN